MCTDREYGGTAIKGLWNDMEKYQSLAEPFNSELAKGETPDMWWTRLGRQETNSSLSRLLAASFPSHLMQLTPSGPFPLWE